MILVKIFEKFRVPSNFRKISILVKFMKKNRFWWKLWKNFDFGKNFRKFRKIPISLIFSNNELSQINEKIRFWSKFSKNSIWVKFSQKFRFRSTFSKNFDFSQNFEKISILLKFLEMSISVKTFDFGQNFR